jgi:2,3-dihydroxybenzoate decarboxylase
MTQKTPKGTIAIEEAVLNPAGLSWIAESAPLFNPGQGSSSSSSSSTDAPKHGLNQLLLDIHNERLAQMDAHGVEYMLLSLTSPGAQGEPDPAKARALAAEANNWLAAQVAQNPARFGAFAAVSMHNAADAVAEATRAVRELGMFGVMVNDYQSVGEGGNAEGKKYYDEAEFRPFWKAIDELGLPVYLHPRYPPAKDLQPGTRFGDRKHILGAAVQFHLDLSMHLYAICSSGVFDEFPKVQVMAGHLGEG